MPHLGQAERPAVPHLGPAERPAVPHLGPAERPAVPHLCPRGYRARATVGSTQQAGSSMAALELNNASGSLWQQTNW